jgi:hypothetical protein
MTESELVVIDYHNKTKHHPLNLGHTLVFVVSTNGVQHRLASLQYLPLPRTFFSYSTFRSMDHSDEPFARPSVPNWLCIYHTRARIHTVTPCA